MLEELKTIKYSKSPLKEVIFQLRFPTILRINSEQPIDFQEQIRDRYPFLETFDEQLDKVEEVLNPQLAAMMMQKAERNKNYDFISKDGKTKVGLTSTFIAISTFEYDSWECFRERIRSVLPIFESIYMPPFYSRMGLRYLNVLNRGKLGLEGKKWEELVQPSLFGIVKKEHESKIKSYISEIEYETDEVDVFSRTHFEFVRENAQAEISLLIDCDYFTLKVMEPDKIHEQIEKLHLASSQFMHSAITEELHKAMQPVEI